MKNLKQLYEERTSAHDGQAALLDKADGEKRDLTAEEEATYTELANKFASLTKQIDRLEAHFAQAKALDEPAPTPGQNPIKLVPETQTVPAVAKDESEEARHGFSGFGEFALSVHAAYGPSKAIDNRLLPSFGAATGDAPLRQGLDSKGGFLVPPEFSTAIWDLMQADGNNLLAATDQYTVTRESISFPAIDETDRAAGSRWGGVRGYWIAEGAAMTESSPSLREVKIEPKQLAVMISVTDKLLRNSAVAVEQFLTRAASAEIAFLVGDSIINGDGAGKPQGVLTSSATIGVTKETGQAATTIVAKNIHKMYARMHSVWRSGATWYINQDIESQLHTMTLDVGTGGMPIYVPPGGFSAAPYATLLGKPVIPIEYCQTLGTKGDILLANLKAYCSGTRGGVQSAMSMHLLFDYNKSVFRFLFEVDGTPWITSALTPFKGTATLSPFVALNTRS